MKEKEKETLLIIPYTTRGAQGGELETAVHGWLKNWEGAPLRIVVMGEASPVALRLQAEGKVTMVSLPDRPEHAGEPELARTALMVWAISYFSGTYEGCIWSDDDIYPVNPFGMKDVKILKGVGNELSGSPESGNWFLRAMYRTRRVLSEAGLPIYNYSSHCPRWYDFDRLSELISEYGLDEVPHLTESLYFNRWYPKPAVRVNVNAPGNRYKYGIYTDGLDLRALAEAMAGGVLWVNSSPVGWSRDLVRAVRSYNDDPETHVK